MTMSNSEMSSETQRATNLAINFNNAGVTLMDTGTLGEAWGLFKGALETLMLIYRNDCNIVNASSCGLSCNPHIQYAMKMLGQEGNRGKVDGDRILNTSSDISSYVCGDSTHCFVPHPFAIQGLDFTKPETPMLSITVVSAVVLYNLALVDHMRWLESTKSDMSMIEMIVKLYTLSCTIAHQQDLEGHLVHLSLALLNNLGQLFYELGQYEMARMYLDDLSNRMSILSLRGRLRRTRDNSTAVIMGSQPWEGFLSNIMLLHAPTAASSA